MTQKIDLSILANINSLSELDESIEEYESHIQNFKNLVYIFKIISLVNDLKAIVQKGESAYKESMIKIKLRFDWDLGWILSSGVRLSDRYQYHNPTSEVKPIFDKLERIKYFNPLLSGSMLKPDIEYFFLFNEYDKVRSYLLNEDIIKQIDYFSLVNLLKNNCFVEKKSKI